MRARVTRRCAASAVPRDLRADARAAPRLHYSSRGRLAILSLVMRTLLAAVAAGALASAVLAAAQAPQKPAARPAPKPAGTLAQVMRGVYFPNANLIFDVQQNDPGAPRKPGNSGSSTDTYSSAYSEWDKVENAAIALTDSVDLILKNGRRCQNGKPV